MEFAKHFDGEQGRMSVSKTIDNDISKAMSILEDPFTYRDVFIQ